MLKCNWRILLLVTTQDGGGRNAEQGSESFQAHGSFWQENLGQPCSAEVPETMQWAHLSIPYIILVQDFHIARLSLRQQRLKSESWACCTLYFGCCLTWVRWRILLVMLMLMLCAATFLNPKVSWIEQLSPEISVALFKSSSLLSGHNPLLSA